MSKFEQFLFEQAEPKKVIAYHGSNSQIKDFKYEFTNKGNDQLGSGFYFTSDINDAKRYGKIIHKVELTFKNLLDANKRGSISPLTVRQLILNSPDVEDSLTNWDDVDRYGVERVLNKAVPNYVVKNDNILRGTFNIANDFYGDDIELFNKNIFKFMKYDGVIKRHEDGTIHYMAFFPSQIKILEEV